MSHAAPIRALALAVALVIFSAAPAHAGTIVFDFEDGLQGWELIGSAQRVQTQLLGGEWAIFGDGLLMTGRPSVRWEMDLTGVVSLSVEQHFIEGHEDGLSLIAWRDPIGPITFGTLVPLVAADPSVNPSLREADLSSLEGVAALTLSWGGEVGSVLGESPTPLVAFIDNITFHTIPEPTVLVLLMMGGAALTVRRRARGRRHV